MLKTLFFLSCLLSNSHQTRLETRFTNVPNDSCPLAGRITYLFQYFGQFFQVVLLVDDKLHLRSHEVNYIRKCLLQRYPAVIIDFQSVHVLNGVMQYPLFGSPRSTTFFIMLDTSYDNRNNENFIRLSGVLDDYIKYFSRPIRPRWLSIFLNGNRNSTENFDDFLLLAWRKKFLDFTILETRHPYESLVHTYNPFLGEFSRESLDFSKTFFPDKLNDMNGCPLKTIFIHDPPSLFLQQNSSGHITTITGTDYSNVKEISKAMNFSLEVLPTFPDDYVNDGTRRSYRALGTAVIRGDVDFGGTQLYLWTRDVFHLERSFSLKADGHCALVYIERQGKVQQSMKWVLEVLLCALYMTLLVITIKLFRFDKRFWNWLTLTQMFLGSTMYRLPGPLKERILMACIILTCTFYLSNNYARIVHIKLTTYPKPYHSLAELDQSGLTPLVYPHFFNETFSTYGNESEVMMSLKSKARLWYDPMTCADEVIRKPKSSFCILPESLARGMANLYHTEDNKALLGVSKSYFWITWKGYTFTPGSPYVEKFDVILEWLFEAGIRGRPAWPSNEMKQTCEEEKVGMNISLLPLLIAVGYLLSVIAFLAEKLWFWLRKSCKKNR